MNFIGLPGFRVAVLGPALARIGRIFGAGQPSRGGAMTVVVEACGPEASAETFLWRRCSRLLLWARVQSATGAAGRSALGRHPALQGK